MASPVTAMAAAVFCFACCSFLAGLLGAWVASIAISALPLLLSLLVIARAAPAGERRTCSMVWAVAFWAGGSVASVWLSVAAEQWSNSAALAAAAGIRTVRLCPDCSAAAAADSADCPNSSEVFSLAPWTHWLHWPAGLEVRVDLSGAVYSSDGDYCVAPLRAANCSGSSTTTAGVANGGGSGSGSGSECLLPVYATCRGCDWNGTECGWEDEPKVCGNPAFSRVVPPQPLAFYGVVPLADAKRFADLVTLAWAEQRSRSHWQANDPIPIVWNRRERGPTAFSGVAAERRLESAGFLAAMAVAVLARVTCSCLAAVCACARDYRAAEANDHF